LQVSIDQLNWLNQKMRKPINEHIIVTTLHEMVYEQAEAGKLNTDNAPSSDPESAFTPAEKKFLGKFDAYGSKHLGIIYSPSETGIREFIARSGKDLNCTPDILLGLVRDKIIKIVPYTGFGRNNDYTIELQLSLDDIKGFGAEDKEEAEKGSASGAAPTAPEAPPPPPPPGPENAGVVKSGTVLKESNDILRSALKKLLSK
jgi:hypothetical protein